MEEIELLEAAEFAHVRSEGRDKLFILFWRNARQHKDLKFV
jgi:hypothetical protein